MSPHVGGLSAAQVHEKINLLIHNLINIKDDTGKFLQRLPDGRSIDTKGWNGWDWTHGIGLYGLYQYHQLVPSAPTIAIIRSWFDTRLAEGTTKNINTMAVMLTLVCMYHDTHEKQYLPHLVQWAGWAMFDLPRTRFGGFQHITYENENLGELWDDTLMMTVMPLAKVGKVLHEPEYVEEAKRQFLLHIQYLFDTSTGLFFHGWKFSEQSSGALGHNFARARWARGNAWMTIAIPEFLDLLDLPRGDAFRSYLEGVLQAQCAALRRLQDENGMWRTLLDVPEADGSYVEASATAGFAYGIMKAVRKQYISEEYADVGARAATAILARISSDGELQDVSFGTAMGHDLEHYLKIERTSMPYGQAMAIMALVESLRLLG